MASTENVSQTQGTPKPVDSNGPASAQKTAEHQLLESLGKSIGKPDLKLSDLGELTLKFLKDESNALAGKVRDGALAAGVVRQETILSKIHHEADQLIATKPSREATTVKWNAIMVKEEKGRNFLAGKLDGAFLDQVLETLLINKNDLNDAVAKILRDAISSKADLSKDSTRKAFVTNLTQAKFGESRSTTSAAPTPTPTPAETIKTTNGATTTSKPGPISAKDAARSTAHKGVLFLLSNLGKKLGKPDLEVKDLGKFARMFLLDEMHPQLLELATKGESARDHLLLGAIDMESRHKLDQLIAEKPTAPALIDGKLTIKAQDGKQALDGAYTGTFVEVVLKALNIDPKDLRTSAPLLRKSLAKKKDLGDDKARAIFVTELALNKFAEIKAKDATAAAPAAPTEKKKLDPNMGAVPKSAPSTSNTGSRNNALAIRAALLSGLNNVNESVERTASAVLKKIFEDLGINPRSGATKAERDGHHELLKKLHSDIAGLLKPSPGSVDAKVSPTDLFERIFNVLVRDFPEASKVVDPSIISAAVLGNKDKGEPKFTDQLLDMTVRLLSGHVASAFGVEDAFKKATNELAGELLPHIDAAKPKEPEKTDTKTDDKTDATAPKAEGTGTSVTAEYAGTRSDIPAEAKGRAQNILKVLGLKLDDDPVAAQTMLNLVAKLTQTCTDSAGRFDPVAFTVGVHKFLEEYAGASPRSTQDVREQLAEANKCAEAPKRRHLEKLSRIAELESGKKGNCATELAELKATLKSSEDEAKGHVEHLNGLLDLNCRKGLEALSAFVKSGGIRVAGGGGGGGGDNIPPRTGAASPGDPGGRRQYVSGNNPGITGGGRPEDADGKNLTAQQERAIKCAEILRDPSLCIEDKIFLFMMWFVFYADKEREKKMEEMVAMDRANADIARNRDTLNAEIKNLQENAKIHERRLVEAERELDKVQAETPPNPDKLKAAVAAHTSAQADVTAHNAKIAEKEDILQGEKLKQDEGTRSREIMFMELDRFTKMRDKVMDMARSMLENSNRNLEKIFR